MAITRNPSPVQYSESYKRTCFHVWYSRGRIPMTKLVNHVPAREEDGARPNQQTLQRWRTEMGWDDDADRLDEEVALDVRRQLISDRVETYREHAKLGKKMRLKAEEWLEDHELEKPHEAMRLMQIATTLEQQSVGVSKVVEDIAKMDEDDVKDELTKLFKNDELMDEGELRDMLEDGDEL